MYELVELRENDVFTNSKVIAEGTNNKHHAVQQIIQKYEAVFIKEFGAVAFEMRVLKHENGKGSTKEKVYLLNEGQAMFLMTFLRNDGVNGIVVAFKARLAKEFIRMRNFIKEKQSKAWSDTRIANKENRLKETGVIKSLVDYAKEQGSTHSDKLYLTYTKLAKSIVGGNRDSVSISEYSCTHMFRGGVTMANRLELTRYGKDEPIRVEPRLLIENTELSNRSQDSDTENMLIHGDNLLALKALEKDYAGQIENLTKEGNVVFPNGKKPEALIQHIFVLVLIEAYLRLFLTSMGKTMKYCLQNILRDEVYYMLQLRKICLFCILMI